MGKSPTLHLCSGIDRSILESFARAAGAQTGLNVGNPSLLRYTPHTHHRNDTNLRKARKSTRASMAVSFSFNAAMPSSPMAAYPEKGGVVAIPFGAAPGLAQAQEEMRRLARARRAAKGKGRVHSSRRTRRSRRQCQQTAFLATVCDEILVEIFSHLASISDRGMALQVGTCETS